jgi:glycerophosphoryl diester phosphodiesterase
LASVRAALKAGAKWVEIDVQMSADGVPVVYHDTRLSRVSGRRGDIRSLPFSEIRRLPAHEPGRFGSRFAKERVASLAQLARLFARFKGARLFVEIKAESLKRHGRVAVLQAVDEALRPIRRRCVIISFDEGVLRLARFATRYPLGAVLTRRAQLKGAFWRVIRPEFAFSSERLLPKSGSLRIRGSRLCVYEVPERAKGEALLARGADLIETFAIDSYLS